MVIDNREKSILAIHLLAEFILAMQLLTIRNLWPLNQQYCKIGYQASFKGGLYFI